MKKNLKLVVVGDGACGKTSLIIAHAGGEFSESYIPTAFDDYSIESHVEGKPVRLRRKQLSHLLKSLLQIKTFLRLFICKLKF